MAKKRREYSPREMRLVADFIAKHYPKAHWKSNVRLGMHHPQLHAEFLSEAEQRMVGVFRRYADAIIFESDKIILIEAAILPQPGKVSTLEMYKMLIPSTPELSKFKDLPIEMVLLCAINDPFLTTLAREKGIEVVMFRSAWIEEYIESLFPRQRVPTLTYFE